MKAKSDRQDNPIGNGNYHVSYDLFDFSEFPFIVTTVNESKTTESVYVTYTNNNNGKIITVRFSWHENNATKFGDQLNGNVATREEVLYNLGIMNRTFVPDTFLFIEWKSVKKSDVKIYREAELTLKEMYALGAGADISMYTGKLAKGSNRLIIGTKVEELNVTTTDICGHIVDLGMYIYE